MEVDFSWSLGLPFQPSIILFNFSLNYVSHLVQVTEFNRF